MGGIGSGGARRNAGRKAEDGQPRAKISLSIPSWLLDLIQTEARRKEIPVSALITELITKGLER